jgi:hypothetical protein
MSDNFSDSDNRAPGVIGLIPVHITLELIEVHNVISRQAAILKNPSIADIQLQPQPRVVLPAVRKP